MLLLPGGKNIHFSLIRKLTFDAHSVTKNAAFWDDVLFGSCYS
jgi:hypothetical protein